MIASYTVSLLNPQSRYFHITLHLKRIHQDEIFLKFPVWIPGSYMIREFAKDLSHFEVHTPTGKRIAWEKRSKSEWKIRSKGEETLLIRYRIYGAEIGVHSPYLDHCSAFFNGANLFFYTDACRDDPVSLELLIPKGWRLATGLRQLSRTRFKAENIDELYDCPFQLGRDLSIESFTAARKKHRVAILGDTLKARREILQDLKKIVETQIRLFGEAPYAHYSFLIHFSPGLYGGLEHRNSSANLFDGWLLKDKDKYRQFLALLSHEYFHTWNVKRIRPRALGPFDYSQEVYTRELWLAEGMTSYYDDQLLLRAGLMSREDYLSKVVTANVTKYENQPAKSLMSLSDSSFDAWIKLYRPTDNSPNTTMSYYLKGGLVMMLLDMEIIVLTDGKRTLDDVLRRLWRLYLKRPELGVSRDEFDTTVMAASGSPRIVRFLRDMIDAVKPIPWTRLLARFGILRKEKPDRPKVALGIQVLEKNGSLVIGKVLEGSAAFSSNLQAGDEILAVGDYRMSKEKNFTEFLTEQKIESHHTILYSRRGRVESAELALRPNRAFTAEFIFRDKPTAKQRRLRERWLRK